MDIPILRALPADAEKITELSTFIAEQCGGNVSLCGRHLGISRHAVFKMMRVGRQVFVLSMPDDKFLYAEIKVQAKVQAVAS